MKKNRAWMVRPKGKPFQLPIDDFPQVFNYKGDAQSVKWRHEVVVRVEIREVRKG